MHRKQTQVNLANMQLFQSFSERSELLDAKQPCVLSPLWGLQSTYAVYLRVIEKRPVVFLLVWLNIFSLGVTAEAIQAKID